MVVKQRVANVDVQVQEEQKHGRLPHASSRNGSTSYFHLSSRLGQRPSKELKSRKPTRRGAEHAVSCSLICWTCGNVNRQPNGGVKVATRSVMWTVALNLIGSPLMWHMVMELTLGHSMKAPHNRKRLRPAKRGETARRRKGGRHALDVRFWAATFVSLSICCNMSSEMEHRYPRRNWRQTTARVRLVLI